MDPTALKERDPSSVESNEDLYRRYLRGDESGLRSLVERLGDNLVFYINGYIHDLQEAEDLMIEAFSRVLAKQPRFDENGFKTYLFKTGRNLALRHIKRSRPYCGFSFEELESELAPMKSIEDSILLNEQSRIIGLSLEKINPDYREALYLFYFEKMSYVEMAEVMKKTKKQVANLIYRGKQALRPILEKEGMTDAEY